MDPGLDPQFETDRRQRPLGWGGATLALVGLVAALGLTLQPHRRGTASLVLAGFSAGWLMAEVGLHLTVDTWAAHVKIRSNCYHDNPRGYFKRSRFYDDPNSEAWCVDDLSVAWRECEGPRDNLEGPRRGVLALGDSFTDGVGVFHEDTWPTRLAEHLDFQTSDEVVNCGRSDSYVAHIAKRYLTYEERHRPAVVVYAMVLNDVAPPDLDADRPDISFQIETRNQYGSHISKHPLWGPLSAHSALARIAIEQWSRWRLAAQTAERYRATYSNADRTQFVEAMNLVGDMNQVAQERGSRFLVALWPLMHDLKAYPFASAHSTIAKALEERGVPFMDLLPTFAGADTEALQVHPTDHHPNEIAHDTAAKAIAMELKRRGWSGASETP
ncbi:MAG: GDSL-type esterase/lipase family protein [Myxococcota bacterium]|nr:GDSL-type esterase/lipase family protein [Myxococcota bacterium]